MKTLYFNGDFLTVNSSLVEALLCEDGKIIKLMGNNDILGIDLSEPIIWFDLHGATLMPSFIDIYNRILSNTKKTLDLDAQKKLANYTCQDDEEKSNEDSEITKNVDFFVLNNNPFKIDVEKIHLLQIIKCDKIIFDATN